MIDTKTKTLKPLDDYPAVTRDHAEVHLVGAIGQAQAAGTGVGGGEREVLAHPAAAVQLDGEVDDLAGHPRDGGLDLADLAGCTTS